MRIEFDFDHAPDGSIIARHFVDTSDPTVVNLLKGLHLATTPFGNTGWDVVTRHPSYPAQTRLQAVLGEIIRLNDTATRSALGI